MARGTQHSDETRAQVTAALLSGQGVREVSRELGVPVATVSRAKRDLAAPRAASSAKANRKGAKAQRTEETEFAPDDSASFEADVEEGLRGADWVDSEDYRDAGISPMRLSTADAEYLCPVEKAKPIGTVERVGTQKNERPSLDALIFDYLSENLATLRAQAIISRDPRWVKCYAPGELAILHGVIADKTIRILECAEAARPIESVSEGEVVEHG